MRFLHLLFCLPIFYWESKATLFPVSTGAVSLGLGTIVALKTDPFAAYNHAGSLAFAESNSVSLAFQSQFFVEGLNQGTVAAHFKLNKTQMIGLGYNFFGNQHYNEGLLKLTFSNKFSSQLGAGISLDYMRLQLPRESYPVKHLVTFETGLYAKFNSNFDFALLISNPIRVRLARYNDERLPFVINTTLIYNMNKKLTLAAEWHQIVTDVGSLKIGLEYQVTEKLILRTGMFNNPMNPCFGISYKSKKLRIHLAYSLHPFLNTITSSAITYSTKNYANPD